MVLFTQVIEIQYFHTDSDFVSKPSFSGFTQDRAGIGLLIF